MTAEVCDTCGLEKIGGRCLTRGCDDRHESVDRLEEKLETSETGSGDVIDDPDRQYLEPTNGIAEAISYPDPGEEVTLRGNGGTAIVERIDRRRNFPVILKRNHPFRAVRKRTIVEYSQRVDSTADTEGGQEVQPDGGTTSSEGNRGIDWPAECGMCGALLESWDDAELVGNSLLCDNCNEESDDTGLHAKYTVLKDGETVEDCFVLEPESDQAAREALWTYAAETDDEELETDLRDWLISTVGSAEKGDS